MEISNGRHQAMVSNSSTSSLPQHHQHEKQPKYQQNQSIRCPRCDSTNTKFCYYNNYSLSQPRYFCKGCKRYWTKGGALRNIPVGGTCNKNKKSSSSSSSTNKLSLPHKENFLIKNRTKNPSTCNLPMTNLPLPHLSYDPNDLTLTFDPFVLRNHNPNPNPSFLDILRGPSQFQSLCYGFGGGGNDHGVMLPFHGGSDSTTATTATGMVQGNDDVGANASSLGLDTRKDYNNWNGVGLTLNTFFNNMDDQ